MTDDPTKDLTAVEMLRLVLTDVREMKTRLGAVEDRLGALEALVEDRLKDTRPIWQAINQRTENIEKEIRSLHRKLDIFNKEILVMKTDIRDFDERLTDLERKPN
jgi:chromosome segregation ATPase